MERPPERIRFDNLLVDGYSIGFRTGFAFVLSGEGDKPTQVTYGLLKFLNSFLERYEPKTCCIAWDCKGSDVKKNLFPEYKANRAKPEPLSEKDIEQLRIVNEIKRQMDDFVEIAPMFGLKSIRKEGVEADDIIGVLCENLKNTLVVSYDRDLLQVVNLGAKVYYLPKDTLVDAENFQSIFGVPPELFVDYKCLLGDSGDNIDGLRGFGEVTSKKLVNRHGAWKDWFIGDKVKMSILSDLNKSQKVVILDKISQAKLDRNHSLIKLGHLLDDATKAELMAEFYNQKPKVDPVEVRKFLLSNSMVEFVAGFNSWIHPFKLLGEESDGQSQTDQNVQEQAESKV
jgi:5'-3' exonuclease